MHRNLKPENILLESASNLNIKLSDFGLATYFNEEGEVKRCGSPLYVAPEVIKGPKYTEKVDIWSIGVIAYILLRGSPPFHMDSIEEAIKSFKTKGVTFRGSLWQKVSQPAKDFILACL